MITNEEVGHLHEMRDESAGVNLLALTHRDGTTLYSVTLSQSLDLIGGIRAHRQQTNQWCSSLALQPSLLQV